MKSKKVSYTRKDRKENRNEQEDKKEIVEMNASAFEKCTNEYCLTQ